LYFFYKSTDAFPEVKRFYLAALQPKGWTAEEEPAANSFFQDADGGVRIVFVKGNYKIIVEHNAASSSRWQYSMDYVWDAK
jgi:hypothetical protein